MTAPRFADDPVLVDLYRRWWDEAGKLCWLLLPEARAVYKPVAAPGRTAARRQPPTSLLHCH